MADLSRVWLLGRILKMASSRDHVLSIDDFNEVDQTCEQFSAEWKKIGGQLGIKETTIDIIAANNTTSVKSCMSAMLASWLKRECPEQPLPTWKILCDAIATFYMTSAMKIATDKGVNITCTGLSHPPVNSTVLPANKLPKSDDNNVVRYKISEKYHPDFDEKRGELRILISKVTRIFKNKLVSFDDLKYFLSLYPELRKDVETAESLNDAMRVVCDYTSLTNTKRLEAVAKEFNLQDAIDLINKFNNSIDEFCQTIQTQHIYGQDFMEHSHKNLLQSDLEEVNFVLEWDGDNMTLSDIQSLLRKAFHSEARHVMVKVVNKWNSFIVICYAPLHVREELIRLVKDNEEDLRKEKVLSVTIGGFVIFKTETGYKFNPQEYCTEEKPLYRSVSMEKQTTKRIPVLLFDSEVHYPPVDVLMTNFNDWKNRADHWFSPSFYTYHEGYKMCVKVHAYGQENGRSTHVSVYVHLMSGNHDDKLSWPFRGEVKLQLLNRRKNNNHKEYVVPFDDLSQGEASQRVINGLVSVSGISAKVGEGSPQFIKHEDLAYKPDRGTEYLRDDSLFFRILKVTCLTKPKSAAHSQSEIQGSSSPVVAEFTMQQFSGLKASNEEWESEPFFSHEGGYKFILVAYANGKGSYKGRSVSVYAHLVKGENDSELPFPFRGRLIIQIINCIEDKHHAQIPIDINDTTDPDGICGARVSTWSLDNLINGRSYNGLGFPNFLRHEYLGFNEDSNTQYVNDDDELKIRVEKVDVYLR